MPRSRPSLVRRPREAAVPKGAAADTLTEQAYRLIEEQIVTLNLKPGDVLSEQLLSATLKIGRTPIREALQRLAREGLVTILPRKGILVADVNPRSQLLLLEVRREQRLDELTVVVEARPAAADEVSRAAARRDLGQRIKSRIGITSKVSVVEPGRIDRSLGKAKRIVDLRTKE